MAEVPRASSLALPSRERWISLVERAIAEDVGSGDVTTAVVVEQQRLGQARIEAREALVVCGLPIVEEVFAQIDPGLEFFLEPGITDGVRLSGPAPLLRVRGAFDAILVAERTALNFLGRLCGIATQTRELVDRIADLDTDLVDTRKTTPGWRCLEKYAVAVGGGVNHRIGLFDAILIKDNHIAAAGGLDVAVKRALEKKPPGIPLQVEVESPEMAERAIELGCDFLLLDNLPPATIREIVERYAPEVLLEASGGIGPANLRTYAETGVARISMGALTHSVRCADVALEIDLIPEAGSGVS